MGLLGPQGREHGPSLGAAYPQAGPGSCRRQRDLGDRGLAKRRQGPGNPNKSSRWEWEAPPGNISARSLQPSVPRGAGALWFIMAPLSTLRTRGPVPGMESEGGK